VGHAIETLFADHLEECYGMLAYHYARAEAWENALEYLLKAGDQASRIAADAEALAHYRQAIEAYERAFGDQWEPLQRARLERKMGEALYRRGEHATALEYLLRTLAYLGRPLPRLGWQVRMAILREVGVQIGHRLLPGPLLNASGGPVVPQVQEEISACESIGWIQAVANPERSALVILRGLNLSERNGFPHGVVVGSMGLGMVLDFLCLFRLAEHYHCRAVALGEQIGHLGAASWAHIGQGLHSNFHLGELDGPAESVRKAAEMCQEIGDLRYWGTATYNQAYFLTFQAKYDQALRLSQDLVHLGQEGADLLLQCYGLSAQGLVLQRLGQYDEAVEALQEAVALANRMPDYLMCVTAGGHLGRCHLCQGRLGEALAVLETGHRVHVEHTTGWGALTPLLNALAEAYLAALEQSHGIERYAWLRKSRRACRDALKQGRANRPGMAEAMRLQGTYERLRDRPAAGSRWWERSLALAEELGQPYQLGMTHLEMGRRMGDRRHVERALKILSAIGAEWDADQARRLLGEGAAQSRRPQCTDLHQPDRGKGGLPREETP
jgi:tetratricopeptide (TPR) repeat protein